MNDNTAIEQIAPALTPAVPPQQPDTTSLEGQALAELERTGQTLDPPEDSTNAKLAQEGIARLVERISSNEIARDGIEVEEALKALKAKSGICTKSLENSLKNVLGPKERTKRRSKVQADSLIALAIQAGLELFHDKRGESYVTLPINEHKENWKLRSEGFRKWLRRLWYEEHRKGVSRNVLDAAIDTLDSKASYEGKEEDIYIRIAHTDGGIYVDLCDDAWQCIQITSADWKVLTNPPVKFIRAPGMLPLPEPAVGGNAAGKIAKLRVLLNVSDATWKRIVAWILSAYSEGPYWILILTGEQGTAKSFATRLIRLTVDPSLYELLTAPQEQRDVIFTAVNGHVLAIDNLSGIPAWLSDLLCGIATGTATRMRAYHTNDGTEVGFVAKRPTIINGIDIAVRDDLASRSLPAALSQITTHKNEKELRQEFHAILPEVLGGIFDILVGILTNLPNTKTPAIRMADAGRWIAAAEAALGWEEGEFMRIYKSSRDETVELAIESDIFGARLVDFMQERSWWSGTQKQLDIALLDQQKPPHGWPTTGKALAGKLKRLAPALRHLGLHYVYDEKKRPRTYTFSKGGNTSVESGGSGEATLANIFASNTSESEGAAMNEQVAEPSGANDTLPGHMTNRQLQVASLEASQDDGYHTSDTSDTLESIFSSLEDDDESSNN